MQSNNTIKPKEAQATPPQCPECQGRGYTVERWTDPTGGPDYVLRPDCRTCANRH